MKRGGPLRRKTPLRNGGNGLKKGPGPKRNRESKNDRRQKSMGLDDRNGYAETHPHCEITSLLDRHSPAGWAVLGPEKADQTHHVHGRGFPQCHRRWNLIRLCGRAHEFCTGISVAAPTAAAAKNRLGTSAWGRLLCVYVKMQKGEYEPRLVAPLIRSDPIGEIWNDYRAGVFAASPALASIAHRLLTLTGRVCPYCERDARLVGSRTVYGGGGDGSLWICGKCDAYVGCHKGTEQALGSLANLSLRRERMNVHKAFDRIWREREIDRRGAYVWLAGELGVEIGFCHIGMFDRDRCRAALEVCSRADAAVPS